MKQTPAVFSNKQLQCPHCKSTNISYVEDITSIHEIDAVDGVRKKLTIMPDGDVIPTSGFNQRLQCEACQKTLAIPEGFRIKLYDRDVKERRKRGEE